MNKEKTTRKFNLISKKLLTIFLAFTLLLTACNFGNNKKTKEIKFNEKKNTIIKDNTTEVLVDGPAIKTEDIDHYFKHGDHWHVITKDGKEYIVYKDPSIPGNLEGAKETEKYGPEQIVEHMELISSKNGKLVLKWLHVDHYHDSIYGISDDIEGVVVEEAPADYVIDPTKEIPSEVENKRFFRFGSKIYSVVGQSQVKYVPSDKVKNHSEKNLEKDIPANHIVPNIERVYSKNGLIGLYWLHDTPGHPHHHESFIGINDDIDNVKIVNVSLSEVSGLEEIPSDVSGKKYYRDYGSSADTLYVVSESIDNKDRGSISSNIKKRNTSKTKTTQINHNKDLEKNIPANHIVPNIKNIYSKKGSIVLKWLHNTPGNPHDHESILYISDDIKNIKIKEILKSQVLKLQEIKSNIQGKKFYRNYGSSADTLYIVDLSVKAEVKKPSKSITSKSIKPKVQKPSKPVSTDIVKSAVKNKEYNIYDYNNKVLLSAKDSESLKIGKILDLLNKVKEVEKKSDFSHWIFKVENKTKKLKKGEFALLEIKDILSYNKFELYAKKVSKITEKPVDPNVPYEKNPRPTPKGESNVPLTAIVPNVINIYEKKNLLNLYWMHKTENSHPHQSVGVFDKLVDYGENAITWIAANSADNLKIVKIKASQVPISNLVQIESKEQDKNTRAYTDVLFYRKKGFAADKLYFVLASEMKEFKNLSVDNKTIEYKIKVINGKSSLEKAEVGTEITLTPNTVEGKEFVRWESKEVTINNNKFIMPEKEVIVKAIFEDTQKEKVSEKNIPANHIVPNIEEIYVKGGFVTWKWLHKTEHSHYHYSAVGISTDIENVNIIKTSNPSDVTNLEEIPSKVVGKKYYRKSGDKAAEVYELTLPKGLFEDVIDKGDILIVTYEGKDYDISKKEYELAIKENKFYPFNINSRITVGTKFDRERKIIFRPGTTESLWIIWKNADNDDLSLLDSNFDHYTLDISYKNSETYEPLELDDATIDLMYKEDVIEPAVKVTPEYDGAALRFRAIGKDGSVMQQAVYRVYVKGELKEGEVSEHTEERVINTKKIYMDKGAMTFKWWHVNHWHFEPVSFYEDLYVEDSSKYKDFTPENAERLRELSLQDELLDRIYYIYNKRIVYVNVTRTEFLSEKMDEIIRRVDILKTDLEGDNVLLNDYPKEEQISEVNRVLDLYNKLDNSKKEELKDKKDNFVKYAKENGILSNEVTE